MKSSNKYLLAFVMFSIILILVFSTFVIISFEKSFENNKSQNYLEEKNNTVIASGMDGYVFKINENVLFHTLDENIEIMKTDLTFNKDYSNLIANSKIIFSFKNPEDSYYLIKDKKFYIRNKSVNKYIDLETFEVKDYSGIIEGNWTVFQET